VRATRALYNSGGESLEAAIGWLEEHGEDADIDEPLMVPKVGRGTLCVCVRAGCMRAGCVWRVWGRAV